MRLLHLLEAFLLVSLGSNIGTAAAYKSPAPQRIAFDSIRTLTFYDGRYTAARRTKPVPQLTCVGNGCRRYQPDVVQCTSMGDAQWKCQADLPPSVRMGRVEVSCEGWSNADDPYVLKGSCALEYRLIQTQGHHGGDSDSDSDSFGWFFGIIFVGITCFIIFSFIRSLFSARQAWGGGADGVRRGWGGGGGGFWPGGGGGPPGGAPPPPYSKNDPTDQAQGQGQGWRPGFWSGLGLGWLIQNMFNSRRNGYDTIPSWPGDDARHRPNRGFYDRNNAWDRFDEPGPSNLRPSTGFGGTRNR